MKKLLLFALSIVISLNFVSAQIDTSGMSSWKPLYNSMATWDDGAFNMNQTGHPDYGWGVYNSITHGLSGDSIYLIQLQDGSFKQLAIEEKNSMANIYTFRFADIAGTNQVIEQARCVDNTDKLFLYYSIQNQKFEDRDPSNSAWDMVLTGFVDTSINYPVTGFLLNDKTKVSVFNAADSNAAANSGIADTTIFKSDITEIGYKWKKFTGTAYITFDTLVYFVKTSNADVYKLQMTYFQSGGSGKGRVGVRTQRLLPNIGEVVNDTLEMGNGYVNDVYFSLSQGITKLTPRNNWDIAFKTAAFSASIIINSTKNVALYTYPKSDISAWTSLGTKQSQMEATSVYPNPASDIITFRNSSWKADSEVSLSVYNNAGQLVYTQGKTLDGTTFTANVKDLPKGLYHARILNNGSYFTGKIMVSRQ